MGYGGGFPQQDYRDKELNFKGVIITHLDRMSKIITTQQVDIERTEKITDVHKRSVAFLEDAMTPLIDSKYNDAVKDLTDSRARFRELMNLMLRRGMLMERSRRIRVENNPK